MIILAGGLDLGGSEKAEEGDYRSDFEVAAKSQNAKADTDIN